MSVWGVVAQVAGALIGGGISAKGSSDAADAVSGASAEEIQRLDDLYVQQRSDAEPFREASYTALDAQMRLAGLTPPTSVTLAGQTGSPTGIKTPDLRSLSDEGEASESEVQALYLEYLGRLPSVQELSRVHGSNWTERMFAEDMLNSNEFIYRRNQLQGEGPISRRDGGQATGGPAGGGTASDGGYGGFKADPGYRFRFDEGARALEKSAAASGGGLLSGGTGRALTRYGQGFASNEYQRVYDRIARIANPNAPVATQGAAIQIGTNQGNLAMNAANTRASGYVGSANAWGDAAGGVGIAFQDWLKSRNNNSGSNWQPGPNYNPNYTG